MGTTLSCFVGDRLNTGNRRRSRRVEDSFSVGVDTAKQAAIASAMVENGREKVRRAGCIQSAAEGRAALYRAEPGRYAAMCCSRVERLKSMAVAKIVFIPVMPVVACRLVCGQAAVEEPETAMGAECDPG